VSRRNSKTKMKKFDGEKIVIKIGFAWIFLILDALKCY
jgi:hypothetical protein